jgi:hypothetical protein
MPIDLFLMFFADVEALNKERDRAAQKAQKRR